MKPYYIEEVEVQGRSTHAVMRADGIMLGLVQSKTASNRIVEELNHLQTRLDEIASLVKGI